MKMKAVPARQVIEEAIATNDRLGHENLGSLSYTHGFLPRQQPAMTLSASHRAWDQVANDIPHLFRTYAVRKTLDEMPMLSALAEDLSDVDLLRASSLFSILAHLYWYCEPEPPEQGIPPQIQRPWEQISQRLERPAPHLSFIDLNTHNWQLIDPTLAQPFVVENLRMAIPLIGNEDERRFQMTPIAMLYLFSPLLEAMLTAQEAVLHDEPDALMEALIQISEATKYLTYVSLQKVNPNPYSETYINPVVWGKTAALFASPFQTQNAPPGPSGTAIPSFTSMDIFFGRKRYQTTVGHETDRTRLFFPKHWREWLTALEQVSVPDYVMQKGHRTLKGIFDEARDTYAGESGLLSRHRLKAYGFLDLSFKAGRVKTLGGMAGSYSERVWDRLAVELDHSRLERYGLYPQTTHMVPVKRVKTIADHAGQIVRQVVFDIADTGIRYQAGDRCGVLPENSVELIDKTLAALHATGDEMIQLNAVWRWHVNLRDGYQEAAELPLRTLLRFARIRPVDRGVALALYALTSNARVQRILDTWTEDQWEVWDLLNLLAEAGYNTKRLWKAIPGDHEHICRIIMPERWRLYSISSIMGEGTDELSLTVGELRYSTQDSDTTQATERQGTGSSFLARIAAGEAAQGRVSIKVVHPARFSLPQDATNPIVMFAGGTGISPMRGLIEARMRTPAAGATWLFFGTRSPEEFYYQDEFAPYVAAGKLNVRVAFSRVDVETAFDPTAGQFAIREGQRRHIDKEMLKDDNARLLWEMLRSEDDGGQGATLYLCGRTSFANSVLETIKVIIARYAEAGTLEERDEIARNTLYRLIGQDRLMLEIFTTYSGTHLDAHKPQYTISEVVLHNDDEHGYWIIVSGRVYDVNAFNHIHPGGAKIIQSYSGLDATNAYQKIEHHTNSEVDAMLGMYELGVLRMPDFGQEWGVALSEQGLRVITLRDAYYAWVDLLFMVTEIENAVLNDFRVRHEPFTDIERPERVLLTPSKIEQLGLVHERLVTGYLDHVLGSPLPTLWSLTIGLLGWQHLDARWMQQTLTAIQGSEAAANARDLARGMRERLQGDAGRLTATHDEFVRTYGAMCDLLENEDRHIIRALKMALREGVMAFEALERQTIRQGGNRLVAALQTIPNVLEEFYMRLQEAANAVTDH